MAWDVLHLYQFILIQACIQIYIHNVPSVKNYYYLLNPHMNDVWSHVHASTHA